MEQFYEHYEGRVAFREGLGEDENPYVVYAASRQSAEYTAWQSGWYAAEEESRK